MGSRMKIFLILLFIGITGIGFLMKMPKKEAVNFLGKEPPLEVETEEASIETKEALTDEKQERRGYIFVHVCGAVKNEGVYELSEGSRVVDAIKLAGGLTEAAAKHSVNQAELLTDGVQIFVPFEGEEPSSKKGDGRLNINSASKEELMTLPGVGEARADAIIRYRTENGRFKDIKDIMKIGGIKESLFHKLKDKIRV